MATLVTLPGSLNLPVYVGATFGPVAITWKTGDPATPVDLSGYTAAMTVKAGQVEVISLTTENGRITLGGAAGTVTLTISAADTSALAPVTANYDLLLTSPGGQVTAFVAGLCTVRQGQTV